MTAYSCNRTPLLRILFTLLLAACCMFAHRLPIAIGREPVPQVRYTLGADSLAQEGVPKGKLIGPTLFHSKIIENTVRKYWVYVPSQYDGSKPAAVLVFQDGARAINPDGVLRVPQVLENLIHKKQIPVAIGVFITPGQRGSEFPESIGTGNPDNRDREYDVLDDRYARMVIEEILPEVGKEYQLSEKPEDRAIGGTSSGAICAFTVAWQRPDSFRNVVSLIGSYTNIHGGHVYPQLVASSENKPIRIFLQDGENDLRSPNDLDRDWFLQNQKMVASFKEKGYDMAHVFGKGGHSDDHGGAMLPYMLRWIWRDHPDVQSTSEDLVAAAAAMQPESVDLFPGFDAQANMDPTGSYQWENRAREFRVVSTLTLEKVGDAVQGKLVTQRGDEAPNEEAIRNVSLTGNKISFDATTRFRENEFSVTYQGIVTAEGIQGWRMMDFGGVPRDTAWKASLITAYSDKEHDAPRE